MNEQQKLSELRGLYDNLPKNFVREQWAEAAEVRRQRNGVSYINLFTLPGVDCLDVELFRQRQLIGMKGQVYDGAYLTFCESGNLVYGFIKQKLPNAKGIRLLVEDLLVGAGEPEYLHPWVRQKKLFPYDVINLDLPRPPFMLRDRTFSRQFVAMEKVFALQGGHRHSFTLFVTFPAEDGQFDANGEAMLRQTIQSNLRDSSAQFAQMYRQRYGTNELLAPYHQMLLVVVPKLVLRAGTQQGFKITCTQRYTYVGRPKTTTRMVSFIFDCEFQGGALHQRQPSWNTLQQNYEKEMLKLLMEDVVDVNCLLGQEADGAASPKT